MQRKVGMRNGLGALVQRLGNREAVLGSVVVLAGVIAIAASAALYVHPLGRRTISFETTDASSLSVGVDVRVAGITVGKISGISIGPNTVRVDATIEDRTFVGSDSLVEVRMLTPVGGYAVTIVPIGNEPLGRALIPVDRVSVPYSIGDVLQVSPHVTDNVDGRDIHAGIEQFADALQHNSTSVGSIIAGMNSIATVMDRQRDQVRQIMDLTSEYLQTFNSSRAFVFELLRKIEIVESTYVMSHDGVDRSYQLLGDVLVRASSVIRFYIGHEDEVLAAVNHARTAIGDFQKVLGQTIDQLGNLRTQLEAWLGPDGLKPISGGTILASHLCVPIPGRTC
ncbi:MlaD family protein [Nocardia sp. R6R-6]|uniref:MlaD family protein n=1 Tax=Nocardia sp. R6R-6 TaxID=3459303 RepID=UPI00403E3395